MYHRSTWSAGSTWKHLEEGDRWCFQVGPGHFCLGSPSPGSLLGGEETPKKIASQKPEGLGLAVDLVLFRVSALRDHTHVKRVRLWCN